MTTCRIDGCIEPASQFGRLCNRHRRAGRRHGDPEQTGITVHELQPYRRRVAARIAKNSGNSAWQILADRWELAVKESQALIDTWHRGGAVVRHDMQAAEVITKVARDVAVTAVTETALAMYLLLEERPQRFCSDNSFAMQLARRVRGLTDSNAGSYFDEATNKAKRVYRDLSPRALLSLSTSITEVFGLAALFVSRLEKREADAKRKARDELTGALEDLS